MVTIERGEYPDPSTVVTVPASPAEGVNSIAGSAKAVRDGTSKRDEIRKDANITEIIIDAVGDLIDGPVKCRSKVRDLPLAFKLDIVVITEPSLHF